MCRIVKTISEKQKLFEEALGKALEEYLQRRKFLTNVGNEKFYVGKPASRGVCLVSCSNENQIDALMQSNNNVQRALLRSNVENTSRTKRFLIE